VIPKDAKQLDFPKHSYALLSLKVSNEYKPKYQIGYIQYYVKQLKDTNQSDDRDVAGEFELDRLLVDYRRHKGFAGWKGFYLGPHRRADKQFAEFLLVVKASPGRYRFKFIEASPIDFLGFPCASSQVPIYADFELPPNKVVYLGRVEATNRKKAEDRQVRAGPIIGLIPQAIAGFSDGAYDVQVVDNVEQDLRDFRDAYPVLEKYEVERQILTYEKILKETTGASR